MGVWGLGFCFDYLCGSEWVGDFWWFRIVWEIEGDDIVGVERVWFLGSCDFGGECDGVGVGGWVGGKCFFLELFGCGRVVDVFCGGVFCVFVGGGMG